MKSLRQLAPLLALTLCAACGNDERNAGPCPEPPSGPHEAGPTVEVGQSGLSAGYEVGPLVASNGDGYLAVWQDGAQEARVLRAAVLDVDGVPRSGGAMEIGPVTQGTSHRLASGGADYLLLRIAPETGLEIVPISPTAGAGEAIPVSADASIGSAELACTDSLCLVVWIRQEGDDWALVGARVAPGGELLDPEPRVLAHSTSPSLTVAVAGGAFYACARTGGLALRMLPDGRVEDLPKLADDDPRCELEAGSPRTLLLRHVVETIEGGMYFESLRIVDLEGGPLAQVKLPEHMLGQRTVVWDGAAYVFSRFEGEGGAGGESAHQVHALKESGVFEGPGIEVATVDHDMLAVRSPGRILRVGVQSIDPEGARVIAQPITRPDASLCDP